MPGALRASTLEVLVPGQLSAATEANYPPFSMRNSQGELDGIEIRTIKEVCKRIGLEYKPVETKWDSMLVGLVSDEYDICSVTMAITEKRQKKVWFSDGWCESGSRMIVRNDSDIQANSDAEGRNIGVLVSSIFLPLAEKLGGKPKMYKADVEALQDCVNGQVDAVITDGVSAAYAIKTGNLPLRATDEIMDPFQLGWPMVKGKTALAEAINKALADMQADGTFKAICNEYIAFDLTPKNSIRTQFS